ncbi:hypothetical protein CLV35_3329 [Motilibacter peucedani]|uniref:Uncharacterized protein n=1 Tax=Motilibacter peucedani TaxID=598650 RepID=A0A420XM97_9ACTN|nr:hypothetical protein [Motilibacter peucedani]RKS71529.1 hypothetical protein CLV35_3329 [Motilibacter peucedani]
MEETVVLGGTSRRQVVVSVALLLAFGVLAVRWGNLYPLFYGVFLAAATVSRWGDRVRLEPEALVVVRKGVRTTYPWDDLLELSWHRGAVTSGPVARTRGTVWDTPGPAAPAQLGSVVLPLWASGGARRLLEDAAREHGVPFTPDLRGVIARGRLPRLPSDAARLRRAATPQQPAEPTSS